MDRTILHSDMNGFYASCESLYHPELASRPLAVAGDPQNRHGIILAKNELAKSFNVRTGEAIWQAKEKCPDLEILRPNYPLYLRFSKKARKIYYEYTDQVEAFGLDEAWLDCTNSESLFGSGETIAQTIRKRIKNELGLTVSVGVSWNKIFAKFGSDYKKPDAVTVIDRNNYKNIVWSRPVGDLLYVGPATKRKLKNIGVTTIGRLASMGRDRLELEFGKWGLFLYDFALGLDDSPVQPLDPDAYDNYRPIKSIGNSTTTPRDLTKYGEFKLVIAMLAESVAMRLRELDCLAFVVEIEIRYKTLNGFTRQRKLLSPTDVTRKITQVAEELFFENYDFTTPVRKLGVRVSGLISSERPVQLNIFENPDKISKEQRLDRTIDHLRSRYGNNSVRKATTLGDSMSQMDIKKDNIIHPIGYF